MGCCAVQGCGAEQFRPAHPEAESLGERIRLNDLGNRVLESSTLTKHAIARHKTPPSACQTHIHHGKTLNVILSRQAHTLTIHAGRRWKSPVSLHPFGFTKRSDSCHHRPLAASSSPRPSNRIDSLTRCESRLQVPQARLVARWWLVRSARELEGQHHHRRRCHGWHRCRHLEVQRRSRDLGSQARTMGVAP